MSSTLDQVKGFLASPSTTDARASFLAAVPLESLLCLLGNGSSSDEETACQCLVKLLGGDHADCRQFFLSSQGTTLVPAGMAHHSVLVRKTSIGLLTSKTFDEEWVRWLWSQGFLLALLNAVVDPSIQVSSAASSALLKASATPWGQEAIFTDHGAQLVRLCEDNSNSTVQLRVLELVCRIWQLSPECAELSKHTPARAILVGMIDSDDILLQLNAVEIISLLPPLEIGKDVMPKLAQAVEMCGEPIVAARLLECICRFVAELPDEDTDSVSPDLESALHKLLMARFAAGGPSGGQEITDTLHSHAVLCSTSRGFQSFANSGHAPTTIAGLASLIQSLHQPTRLAALEASMRVLQQATSERESVLCERAFSSLAPFLLTLARGPMPEQKIGALCLFRAMAIHAWGLRSMFAESDFLAFITDRRAETFKLALDEKFSVVRTAANHPEILEVVGQERCDALRAFVAQGAYYTPNERGTHPNNVQVASEHL